MPKLSRETELAKEIMRYFLSHPRAADTVEGVARWRLMQQRITEIVAETRKALRWLVDRGFLEEIPTSSSESVFVLKPALRQQAKHFVSTEEESK